MNNTKKLLFAILFLLSFSAFSANIKGHVKDARNGDGLVGASVYLKENTQINDATGLDGSYNLKNVQPGTYTLIVQYYSYATQEKTVIVASVADEITQDFDMQPDSATLKEVQVVGTYQPGSDNYARSEERESNVILNIMSARTIQLLPDVTIADVMQRVSGVNLERSSNGGGRYVIIRGMEKRFVVTTINGIEIPSPENNNRSVPLNIFPAGIVERIEVSKTLIPSMPGSGTAGIVNLVLKDCPDRFILSADAATGQAVALYSNAYYKFNSSVINTQSPVQQMGQTAFNNAVMSVNGVVPVQGTSLFPIADYQYSNSKPAPNAYGAFTIGDRLLHDKLGVILSVDYQNTYSSTNTFIMLQAEPGYGTNISQPNLPLFEDVQQRLYSTQNEREGAHLKLDYDISPKHKISFYTFYFGLNQYRSDIYSDTLYGKGARKGPGQGNVDYDDETRVNEQHIFDATLQGTDTLAKNLNFDWSGSYSRAWQNTPDWGDLQAASTVGEGPNPEYWSPFTRRWLSNTDNDYSGYANLNYKMNIAGQDVLWTIGAMNRDKQRNQFYDSYKFSVTPDELVAGSTFDPSTFNPIGGITSVEYSGINNTSSQEDPNSYSLQENVNAFYAQGKVNLGKQFQVIGGIRDENTTDNYVSNQSVYKEASNGNISYRDYLPSIEVTYLLNSKMNIKASYYASITRPNFFEIVPYSITDPNGIYTDEGNPNLKRTQIDNLDLRYELYPSASEEILVGAFYKVLTDAIEYGFTNATATDIAPENDSNKVTNYGFEIQAMKKFLRFFEVSGNYTFTQSQITVSDVALYYINYNTPQQQEVTNGKLNETRPLQGQAKSIANLSLIYKEPKIGLDAQLSGIYTGKLISQTSEYYGLDYWQMPMVKLDFSFEKRLSKKYKISLFGKVMNILNTPYLIEIFSPAPYTNNISTNKLSWLPEQSSNSGTINNIVVEKETYGQSWILGIRYKF